MDEANCIGCCSAREPSDVQQLNQFRLPNDLRKTVDVVLF